MLVANMRFYTQPAYHFDFSKLKGRRENRGLLCVVSGCGKLPSKASVCASERPQLAAIWRSNGVIRRTVARRLLSSADCV